MPNQLTGEYDAVLEVRVDAVNRILAILHEKGATEDASPSLPHSFVMRVDPVGDKIVKAVLSKFGYWALSIPRSARGSGDARVPRSLDKAPPGTSKAVAEATEMIAELEKDLFTPTTTRGTAQVQLSSPAIFVPHGSTSQIVVSVQLRAYYIPDPDTPSLPEPIHGEVKAHYFVELCTVGDKTGLEVKLTENDSQIQFLPAQGTNLSAEEAGKIAAQIRFALRNKFEPMSMEFPQDFPIERFKGLVGGPDQVVAVPVNLPPGPDPAPSAIAGVNNIFLKYSSEDFAVAVSKEYILSLIQPFLDALKATPSTFSVTADLGLYTSTATYTVTYDAANATWSNGNIRLDIQGHADTPAWWAPNVNSFKIEQDMEFQFDTGTQKLSVVPVGEPLVVVNVNGPFGGLVENMIRPNVRSKFIQKRDAALTSANSQIEQILEDHGNLDNALKHLYNASDYSQYTSLDIDPNEGLILRGQLAAKTPPPVVVQFAKKGDGNGFSAFKSWIPGGSIERFEWTWRTGPLFLPWKAQVHQRTEEHIFYLPFQSQPDRSPDPLQVTSGICLRVVGTQTDGYPVSGESDGDACRISEGPSFNMPAWFGKLNLPWWIPDPPYEQVMNDAIVAHVNPLSHSPANTAPCTNIIVHFADEKWERPLETLGQALIRSKGRDAPITVMLVLPRGAFNEPRSSFEKRLGSLGQEFTGFFEITEDYEEGWTRMFGVEKTPATYLMNAMGEFVWHQAGPLDAKALRAALDEHLIAGTRPIPRLTRLTVEPGDRAIDVILDYGQGRQLALRRLRGQRVLLNFWKSWSTPCVAELCRLQRLHEKAGQQGAVILAINDGEDPQRIAEIRREHKLTFKLISDPHRRISRRYRVHCWPTTISLTREGIIDRIHFGVNHGRSITSIE